MRSGSTYPPTPSPSSFPSPTPTLSPLPAGLLDRGIDIPDKYFLLFTFHLKSRKATRGPSSALEYGVMYIFISGMLAKSDSVGWSDGGRR